MRSYRARRNFKGEKTTTSVGPNLLLQYGSTAAVPTENSTGRVRTLRESAQVPVNAVLVNVKYYFTYPITSQELV
jgi:hypothetical protein